MDAFKLTTITGTELFRVDDSGNVTAAGTISTTGTDDFGTNGLKADVIQGSSGTTGTFSLSLVDNLASAWCVKQSTNKYIDIVTTDSSESIVFGNTTTNPSISFPGSGTITSAGRITTTDGVASGGARIVGGTLSSQTTPTTVTNSVSTEQTFGTGYTLPASMLKAGSRLRIRWFGEVTASAGTDTLTIKVYIGGTAIVTTTAVDTSANDRFRGTFELNSSAAPGASVACYGFGEYTNPAGMSYVTAQTTAGGLNLATNGTLLIKVTATWSATTATNTVALQTFTVEMEG